MFNNKLKAINPVEYAKGIVANEKINKNFKMRTKKIFWVDIPKNPSLQADKGEWENIDSFETKEEALSFIKEWFGDCDDNGVLTSPLISYGEQEVEDEETL